MKHKAKCRKCGESVDFLPIPGFRKPGEPKYYAVNKDDHQPHYRRCKITLALREAKRQQRLSQLHTAKQKGRLTAKRGEAPTTTDGGQLDAFGYP